MREYNYTLTTTIVGTEDGRETYEIRKTFDVIGKICQGTSIIRFGTGNIVSSHALDGITYGFLDNSGDFY